MEFSPLLAIRFGRFGNGNGNYSNTPWLRSNGRRQTNSWTGNNRPIRKCSTSVARHHWRKWIVYAVHECWIIINNRNNHKFGVRNIIRKNERMNMLGLTQPLVNTHITAYVTATYGFQFFFCVCNAHETETLEQ